MWLTSNENIIMQGSGYLLHQHGDGVHHHFCIFLLLAPIACTNYTSTFSHITINFKLTHSFFIDALLVEMSYGFIFGDLENLIYLNPWHLGNNFVLLNHDLFTEE